MYILEEISYYAIPDNVFELSSWLYHVAERIEDSMKKALMLDLEEIVHTYQNEPTMNIVLRNIQRFIDEELLLYAEYPLIEPFKTVGVPVTDEVSTIGCEEYHLNGSETNRDESDYLIAEEIDSMAFRKGVALNFEKLSIIFENEYSSWCIQDSIDGSLLKTREADTNNLSSPLDYNLESIVEESNYVPETTPKKKSFKTRFLELLRSLSITIRRQF